MKIEELKAIKKFLKRQLKDEEYILNLIHGDIPKDINDDYEFKKDLENLTILRSRILLLKTLIGMVDKKIEEIKKRVKNE